LVKLLGYWKTNVAVVQASLASGSGTNYLQISFTRRPAELGVTYHVQDSPDLQTWSDIATYSASNIVLTPQATEISRHGSPTEAITVRDTPNSQNHPARFLRLNVTRP
jgi:hypothetical protein